MAIDTKRPAPRRVAAARALEAAQLTAAEMHAGGDLGQELPRLVRGTLPDGGLERVMLTLTAESDPSLCALGCHSNPNPGPNPNPKPNPNQVRARLPRPRACSDARRRRE